MIKKLFLFSLLFTSLLLGIVYSNNKQTGSTKPGSTQKSAPVLPAKRFDDGAVNEYGNTCENLRCSGYVTQQGKAVYVIRANSIYRWFGDEEPEYLGEYNCRQLNIIGDIFYYSHKTGSIFRHNITLKRRTQLSSNDTSFMVATKEYIYYVNRNDNLNIYRLKTDGSEDKKIIDIGCKWFGLSNGFIYLTEYKDNKPHVVSVSIDTFEQKIIAENAILFNILDGHVVIAVGQDKYVLDQDGTRTPLDSKGYTYFSHEQQWTRLNGTPTGYLYVVKDGVKKVLVEKPCFHINTTDTKVFYLMHSKEEKIYTCIINHDGTNMQMME